MEKAYLNIRVETSGPVPTVIAAVLTNTFANAAPDQSVDGFWATVDQSAGDTFVLACGEILKRLKVGAEKIPAFKVLSDLLHEHSGDPDEHTWDPEHSDALGG